LFSRNDARLDPQLETEVRAAHAAILDRFERGLSEIEESARALMRSAADETWQGTEAELKQLREKIMRDLSRDQALRGLIAHADERYQAIDVRVGRIEANLSGVERAATTLTTMLGEAAAAGEGAPGVATVLGLGAIEGRIGGIETALEAVRQSSSLLQERLDTGLGEVTALVAELAASGAARTTPTAADGTAVEADLRPVAERLTAVQDYIAEVVEYLSARDQALVDWIQGIAKHTDGVVAAESARVEEALIGRLDFTALEAEGLREAVAAQVAEIADRLQQHAQVLGEALSVVEAKTLSRLHEHELAIGGQTRHLDSITAQLELVAGRLDAVQQAATGAAERVSVGLHERMADLADQMRAESEDMRVRLVDRAREAGSDATREIDERLARLAELVQAALGWSVDEIDRRLHREILRAVSVGMADFVAAMDRRFVELNEAVDQRLATVTRSVDVHIDDVGRRMDEHLVQTDAAMRAGLGALEESITERSAQTVDALLQARLTPATDQISRAVETARLMLEETVVRNVSQRADAITRVVDERGLAAARLIEERTLEISRQLEERAESTARLIEERTEAAARGLEDSLTRMLSDRVAALAAMIRSDNTAIADRLVVIEEQAAAKEAIRAIKELAAAMPQEISEAMDERLAVLGELFRRENKHTVDTVARAATALADRLDKTAIVIGERFDRDVEVVVDQIGSTMQTLASGLQRAPRRPATNQS
jgi:hypothetical protein